MDFTLFLAGILFFFGGYYLGLYHSTTDSIEIHKFLYRVVAQIQNPDKYELLDLKTKIKNNHENKIQNKPKYFTRLLYFLILGSLFWVMRLIVFYFAGI